MNQHELLKIETFHGGVTESADLGEGQFTDSLNMIPDRNRSRIIVRPGSDIVLTYFGDKGETPAQLVGVRNASCTGQQDELILASCLKVMHVIVPLDVSCCRTTTPAYWFQCIRCQIQTGAATIAGFEDKVGSKYPYRGNPDGIKTCFKCSVLRNWNLGAPPYAYTQSSTMMFFIGQGCNAYLGQGSMKCSCVKILRPTVDRSVSSSPMYAMQQYCFRCAHCWTNPCWWLNTCSLRLNICVYKGTGYYYALHEQGIKASSCSIPLFGKSCSCWNKYECAGCHWNHAGSCFWHCTGCFFRWFYNSADENRAVHSFKAHCWNFVKGCYAKPCWASLYVPVFVPCYNRCVGCALFPYANVLAYHKGRVFFGKYEKVNGTFTEIYYHSVDDTRCCARHSYWRPWDESAVTPVDGNVLTVPTSPNSYLTGIVGVESGVLLFFTDRIMLWQWPDSSSPHDTVGGARLETIYLGAGAIHPRAIQSYLNSVYFIGRAPDGFMRLMKLDDSLALSQESKAIDNRINCFDFRPHSTNIDTAMFRDSFFMRLGERIYLYDLTRKAWYPLSFNWPCYNNPIVSMMASGITDRLYISVFDCYSCSIMHNNIYVWPQGLADNAFACSAICWKLEFDNLDFGDGRKDKYIRDVVVEVDNELNTCSITASLYDSQDCTACHAVVERPSTQRREAEKFEFGSRLKNATLRLGGRFDSSVRDGHDGKLGIDSIAIRWKPRSSVEK